ncbi:unnamed protein product [Lactuca saligna]|uniref:Pseudouridylate synthase PUS7L N-terminal domain-containing protein n=1 Tax=Lactuca saligna TaxID=75948 RepID=A0AA35Y997_LACSI|nr:unnamed protein product [Lactuca saligna]
MHQWRSVTISYHLIHNHIHSSLHLTLTVYIFSIQTAEEHESKTTNQPNGNHFSEIESFRAIVGDSDANSLKEFIHKINSNDEDGVIVTNTSIVLSPSSDKVHRTAIHNFFKEKLKFLVTDTVDGPESSSKCILTCLVQPRCTYRAYDAMDETTATSQLVSTPQEQRYLLDTTDPSGYLIFITLVEISNNIQPSKETRKDNQVGVVNYKGSYSQTIAIQREDNMELLYVLHGQQGGVTHVSSILQRWELSLENNERGRGNKKRKGRDETPYDSRGSDPASWKVPQVVSIIACKTCNQFAAMFKKHRSMNQFTIHDLQISNCDVK